MVSVATRNSLGRGPWAQRVAESPSISPFCTAILKATHSHNRVLVHITLRDTDLVNELLPKRRPFSPL